MVVTIQATIRYLKSRPAPVPGFACQSDAAARLA